MVKNKKTSVIATDNVFFDENAIFIISIARSIIIKDIKKTFQKKDIIKKKDALSIINEIEKLVYTKKMQDFALEKVVEFINSYPDYSAIFLLKKFKNNG